MSILGFMLIVLSGAGGTLLITTSKLFKSFRERMTIVNEKLGYMLSCNQCFGLWMGCISYLLVSYKIYILVYGLIVSLVGFIITNKFK